MRYSIRSTHIAVATCALLVATASSPLASADEARDPVAAEALFKSAVELLERNDHEGACAKFAASQQLDPAVSTLVQLARCREREGKLAEAWYTLQQALKLNRDKPDQTQKRRDELDAFMRERVAELEPRVPKLRIVIKGASQGVAVTRNGKPVPAAVLGEALPVDPGPQEAIATANGFVPERRSVTVTEGQTVDIVIELSPASAAPSNPAAPPLAQDSAKIEERSAGNGRRAAGFVIGGIGAAGLATAGVLGILTLAKAGGAAEDASGNADRDAARGTQTAALVTAGIGAAALGAGIALVLTAPARPAARVGFAVAPQGVAVLGQW